MNLRFGSLHAPTKKAGLRQVIDERPWPKVQLAVLLKHQEQLSENAELKSWSPSCGLGTQEFFLMDAQLPPKMMRYCSPLHVDSRISGSLSVEQSLLDPLGMGEIWITWLSTSQSMWPFRILWIVYTHEFFLQSGSIHCALHTGAQVEPHLDP